jgi:hypothetical protein
LTEINMELLKALATEARETGMSIRKISCNSRHTAGLLYYLKLTVPMFSGSAVSKEVLEQRLAQRYPEIWAEVDKLVPDFGREIFQWDWRVPKLKKNVIEKVQEYLAGPRARSVISVYSPCAAVTLEYIRRTETDTSMSGICKDLLEAGFQKRLPGLWKEMEML